MIEASDDTTGSDETVTAEGCPMHQSSTTGAKKHKLSAREIMDNSATFLIAGYETTKTTLAYTSYLLAINPDIQMKLQSEIDDFFEEKPVRSV